MVAYWDQCGAGRSYDPKADPHRLTVAHHLADLDMIIDHLRRAFDRDRIILVGHSWGGILDMFYAQRHFEKVAALIAVARLVSSRESQQQEYAFTVDAATQHSDAATLIRLREIGPPPYKTSDQAFAVESLADRYKAVFHQKPNRLWMLAVGMMCGLVTPWEIPRFTRANQVSLDTMTPALLTLDLRHSVPSVKISVFFLLGRY